MSQTYGLLVAYREAGASKRSFYALCIIRFPSAN
jgi:hypothetical protein